MAYSLLLNTIIWPVLTTMIAAGIWFYCRLPANTQLLHKLADYPHWLVLAGFWVGYLLIYNNLSIWPIKQALDGLFWVLLLALLGGVVKVKQLSVLFVVASAVCIFWPLLVNTRSDEFTQIFFVMLVIWVLVQQFVLSLSSTGRLLIPFLMVVTCALVISFSGSLLIGQITGVLASGLGVIWLLSVFAGFKFPTLPILSTVMLLVGSLLSMAYYFVEVDWLAIVLCISILVLYPVESVLHNKLKSPIVADIIIIIFAMAIALAAIYIIWPEQNYY